MPGAPVSVGQGTQVPGWRHQPCRQQWLSFTSISIWQDMHGTSIHTPASATEVSASLHGPRVWNALPPYCDKTLSIWTV